MITIRNKGFFDPVTTRKPFSWLLVVLLVAVLTGQAASAYTMPCRGTASCCCAAPMAMDMGSAGTAELTAGAAPNCCSTPTAKPCDIERDPLPVALSFAPAFFADSGEVHLLANQWASAALSTDAVRKATFDRNHRPDRGHPPLYLAILTILC